MPAQEQLNRKGQAHIADLAFAAKRTWESACKHDGIPADAKFVCFSDDNPYVQFHQQAVRQWQEARSQFAAGGYVGLSTKDGRAA